MGNKIKNKIYRWILLVQVILIFLILALLLYLHFGAYNNEAANNTCFFYYRTNLFCPTCGGTRALYYLLNGDVINAIRCNALILLLPVVGPATITVIVKMANHKADRRRLFKQIQFASVFLFFLILLFWILRNVSALACLRP